jgi:hypothetical protein
MKFKRVPWEELLALENFCFIVTGDCELKQLQLKMYFF